MFKQVKSAMIWYYIFKFRRRITLIFFLLLVVIFSNAIYSDVVEYLRLKNKLEYLDIVLSLKWFIVIFNISFCIYLLITLFKKDEKKSKPKETINKKETPKKQKDLTEREEQFLHKKKLTSKADLLLKR